MSVPPCPTFARRENAHLVNQVLNKLDLVRDLGSTEDGEEGLLGVLKDLGEVLELLGHEESGGLLREVDTDHTRVGAVGGSEGVVDEDVTELGQAGAESGDLNGVRLDLLAVDLAGALLLGVEAEVLEEDNLAVSGLGDGGLSCGSDAVGEEGDGEGKEGRELSRDGCERVLGDDGSVGAAKVGHEDDGRCSVVESILDRRDRGRDTLGEEAGVSGKVRDSGHVARLM